MTLDLQFTLPSVGAGTDPCSLDELASEHGAICLLLQREYYCTNCRKQVQAVADRYDEFRNRETEVVSVVPESPDTLQGWQDAYDQPVRFGLLGRLSDFFGRMPEAIVVDARGDPDIAWTYRWRSTFDRPSIDDILDEIDRVRKDRTDDAGA